tara:strand:- start:280 stop:858 length:579 start_codon:yes stop_codon:yes gene_type:complete
MKLYKNIVLTIFIFPIFIVLLVSISNIKQKTKIRILTYTSPEISLGYISAISSLTASLISFISIYSLSKSRLTTFRKVNIDLSDSNINNKEPTRIEYEFNDNDFIQDDYSKYNTNIERQVNDPIPTISVPYRILSKPTTKKKQSFYQEQNSTNKNTVIDSLYERQENNEKTIENQNIGVDARDWENTKFEEW